MKHPSIRTVASVIEQARRISCRLPDGRWVPARTIGAGTLAGRVRAAWLVFTGQADALVWEQQ